MGKRLFIILLCSVILASCHGDPPIIGMEDNSSNNLKENLINANRTIAQAEENAIDEYVARRKWQMQKLPSGARMWIYDKGKGAQINMEDSVYATYSIEAINGKIFYGNIEEGFVAGRRQEMVGLDDAVLRMRHESRAKVILPSNLGYGIGGDGDRITQNSILIIDIEIK